MIRVARSLYAFVVGTVAAATIFVLTCVVIGGILLLTGLSSFGCDGDCSTVSWLWGQRYIVGGVSIVVGLGTFWAILRILKQQPND